MKQLLALMALTMMILLCFCFWPLTFIIVPAMILAYRNTQRENRMAQYIKERPPKPRVRPRKKGRKQKVTKR